MARVVAISGRTLHPLGERWELTRLEPDAARDPEALAKSAVVWQPAQVPGTVGQSVISEPVTLDTRFDADDWDWWYRVRFSAPASERTRTLRFDGLATLAEVWLNGASLLRSDNMFVSHERDVSDRLRDDNELLIRFRSLSRALETRGRRARWRSPFVTHPELRRIRTTLFGRMPGFTPLIPPVGPWRAVSLIEHGPIRVEAANVRACMQGDAGIIDVDLAFEPAGPSIASASLQSGAQSSRLSVESGRASGQLRLEQVAAWWPHTHGSPTLYPVCVELSTDAGVIEIDLGKTGFRRLEPSRQGGEFGLVVNGTRLFCRGACWLPLDALALEPEPSRIERALLAMRQAGMNLVRIAGNGVYASDRFYELCDELGILVWQDFAFARFDYPDDEAFVDSVRLEARQLLDRLQLSPALSVVCGNSEVEQQAAMLGLAPELGRPVLFERVLPELVHAIRPDVAYLPSTPSGGAQPFVAHRGVSHYFGVGAYRRPLSDARLAEVRFASECLAFSNLPDDYALRCWEPWKAGIPRDAGASWDFEDVRDFYLESVFGISARELRITDRQRWLELGRVVTGEVMARVLSDWRRDSKTEGALIWQLADFCPGAGCGLLDDRGQPKPAYWFVARALSPLSVHLIDEGLNGVWLHVKNDTEHAFAGELAVALYRDGRIPTARGKTSVALSPRSALELAVEEVLGTFVDSSYAYRFGPPGHDLIAATLCEPGSGALVSEAFHFPLGPPTQRTELGLSVSPCAAGSRVVLELCSRAFAYAVHVEAPGFMSDDDYFHLEPGRARKLLLVAHDPSVELELIRVSAVNAASAVSVRASLEAAQ